MNFIAEGFFKAFELIFSGSEEVWSAVGVSFKLTTITMFVALALGMPLGFSLGYFSFPGKKFIRSVVDTCLAMPTVVVGLLVYAFISNAGPLGEYRLLFSISGMAIGQTFLALPIVVSLTASAIESVDYRLHLTLKTLGANALQQAQTTLWETRYQILGAAITAYGRVVAEVGVSMMLGGNIKWRTRTITTAITLETGKGDFSMGIALGLLLLFFSFALNFAFSFLRRKSL